MFQSSGASRVVSWQTHPSSLPSFCCADRKQRKTFLFSIQQHKWERVDQAPAQTLLSYKEVRLLRRHLVLTLHRQSSDTHIHTTFGTSKIMLSKTRGRGMRKGDCDCLKGICTWTVLQAASSGWPTHAPGTGRLAYSTLLSYFWLVGWAFSHQSPFLPVVAISDCHRYCPLTISGMNSDLTLGLEI